MWPEWTWCVFLRNVVVEVSFCESAARPALQVPLEASREAFGMKVQRHDEFPWTVLDGVCVLTGVVPRQALRDV